MANYTVYIDESGDLGHNKGTRWFIVSAVIVYKEYEPSIRTRLKSIKEKFNLNSIHLRKINDFMRRAYIVSELDKEDFAYINVLVDTNQIQLDPERAYNYACRLLIERVSWYLRDMGSSADLVFSSRGTSKDQELIKYVETKLLRGAADRLADGVFCKITAKAAGSWDLLQLADVCATTTFLAHEVNGLGFCVPCFMNKLKPHLYAHEGNYKHYGAKYFPELSDKTLQEIQEHKICRK